MDPWLMSKNTSNNRRSYGMTEPHWVCYCSYVRVLVSNAEDIIRLCMISLSNRPYTQTCTTIKTSTSHYRHRSSSICPCLILDSLAVNLKLYSVQCRYLHMWTEHNQLLLQHEFCLCNFGHHIFWLWWQWASLLLRSLTDVRRDKKTQAARW